MNENMNSRLKKWVLNTLVVILILGAVNTVLAQSATTVKEIGRVENIGILQAGKLATIQVGEELWIGVSAADLLFYEHDTLAPRGKIESYAGSKNPGLDTSHWQGEGQHTVASRLIACHQQPQNVWEEGQGFILRIDPISKASTELQGYKATPYAVACSTDPNKIYILEGKIKDGYLQPNLNWLIERDVRTMKVINARSFAKCFGKISRMSPIPEREEIRSLYSVPFESNRVILGRSAIALNWPLSQTCPDSMGYGGGQETELVALYFIPELKAVLGWFNPGGMSDGQQELTLFWKDSKGEWIFKELAITGTIIQAVSTLGNAVAIATDVGLYYTPDVNKPFIKITDEVGSAVLLTPKGTVIFGNEAGTIKKFALPK